MSNNKYEDLVQKLINETETKSRKWSIIGVDDGKWPFRDQNEVYKVYTSSAHQNFEYYLAERQIPNYIEEHNVTIYDQAYELAVVKNGIVVMNIDGKYVPRASLRELAQVVDLNNELVDEFFLGLE